jgi:hypothetical protein
MKTRSPDTIWYLLLPVMEKYNIDVSRKYFKTLLKNICNKFAKKRSEIGVITGARAEMYFDGRWESVSFDAIEELAQKGTDIVFIEKEGIIDELKEHADKYGIAMVNSRGYLVEYAHDLIDTAKSSGANIIIITDYDLSGVNVAAKCGKHVHWITMDDTTLKYFGLAKDKRIVVRATNTKLIDHIKEIMQTDKRFAELDIEFLKTSRIEINAVIAAVGDIRFWKFIVDKLRELYPTRNYNRAIKLPSKDLEDDETDLYPNAIKKLILHIREVVEEVVEEPEKKISSEQEKVKGFLEIEVQKKKNKEIVMKVIAGNDEIKKIESSTNKLCESLGIDLTVTDTKEDTAGDDTKMHSGARKKTR